MHRFDWLDVPRAAALACLATACMTASAVAQTAPPAATAPVATTPSQDVTITGKPIAPNGTDEVPSPGTNDCYARLFKPKDVPATLVDESTVVAQYRLRCSSDVSGYTFGFNRSVVSAETEVFPTLLASNALIADESFSCAGDFPGWGISCTGTYKGRFSTIRGLVSFELTDEEIAAKTPFCKLGLSGTASVFTSAVSRDPYTSKALVNKDGTSQIRNLSAGPFRVTTPACHRGAAKAAKSAKAAEKQPTRKG